MARTPRSRRSTARPVQNLSEALEPRVLLSGGARHGYFADNPAGEIPGERPPGDVVAIRWNGGAVYVKQNSWLMSFAAPLSDADARATAAAAAQQMGVKLDSVNVIGRGKWAQVTTSDRVIESGVTRAVRALPMLTNVEPDRVYSPSAVPNDAFFAQQWWLQNTGQFIGQQGTIGADIHITNAWNTTSGTKANIVAVVDTGVQWDHPDLAGNIFSNPNEIAGNGIDDDGNGFVDDVRGWDFGESDANPMDQQGHGTACAGMIGAVSNNAAGVAGVNWAVSIMPIKIADRFGALSSAAIVAGHDYLTMMIGRGHNIVASNNSYGGFDQSIYKDAPQGISAEKDAIAAFIAAGATFVVSAGNSSYDNDNPQFTFYPSSYNLPGLISVAATDNTDTIAGFSDYGAQTVTIGAPGVNTLTTALGSGYTYFAGTSAAGPVIAGVVAIMKSFKPNASAVEIRQAIVDSADPLPSLQGKCVSGGRVNVERALRVLGIDGPVLRSVDPGPITGQIDINTGQTLRAATLKFNKDLNTSLLLVTGVSLTGDGVDNLFGTSDDVNVPILSIAAATGDPRTVVVGFNLASFAGQRLPLDKYRLTLDDATFKDTSGNFLNGNGSAGEDEQYAFSVIDAGAENEPNDTLLTATPVAFNASGVAVFTGAVLGNGLFAALDVDLYRLDLPRGGEITAEIVAKRLAGGSTLDSVVRLFDATGKVLAINDQFYGQDSFIDFFVTTGGAYYLGVSGFGNDAYNNKIAGSGSVQSRGGYTLKLGAQIVGDDSISADDTLSAAKRIPTSGSQGTITDTITVTDARAILDANVRLDILHDFDGDLIISLTSPAGRTVNLINRRGGSGKNLITTTFDDEASQTIASGAAPFTGTFRPEQALSGFDGQSALGVWTLTITDAAALNSGQLVSWGLDFSLSNNIFGPFESNDTITTAKSITEVDFVNGGSATRDAFLGDGGFGLFDRDTFMLNLNAGATVTLAALPTNPPNTPKGVEPSLNAALRLFDATGHEIANSSPTDTKDARLSGLVVREGGIYYVVVSEGANTTYDPFIASSGVAAITTGNYQLTIQVAAGVSDRDRSLDGSVLRIGFNAAGTFLSGRGQVVGTPSGEVGLRWNGIEFLFDDALSNPVPKSFFGLAAGGNNFTNQTLVGAGGTPQISAQLPLAMADQSDALNRRVVGTGLFGNIQVERSLSYGLGDSFAAVDVYLTNIGASAISNVSWMEGFNPDQGFNTPVRSPNTSNDIDNTNPLVTAKVLTNTYLQGLTIGLGAPAADARASARVVSSLTKLRDPAQLLATPNVDPNGATSDDSLALAYDLGTLNGNGVSGSVAHLRYFIFFGGAPGDVNAMYAQVNNGTGTGHLTADGSTPAGETLSNGAGVPTLPFRVYYPEGFANARTFTFLPILNPSTDANRVVVIARYETGERDQVLADMVIPAGSRGGLTITSPELYAAGTLLVRKDTPYALEIRAQTPVAATFSHYDEFILAGAHAGIGESFTTRVGSEWTFGQITKDAGTGGSGAISDFLLFMNVTETSQKVETTFYPLSGTGGSPVTITQVVEPYRRGGLNINDVVELAAGDYGVKVVAEHNIVASLSHYDRANHDASGLTGSPDEGSLTGAIPEGRLGLGADQEIIGVLNSNPVPAVVNFSFLLGDGTTYRTVVNINPNSHALVNVGQLPAFPLGQNYSVLFNSDVPVSVGERSLAYGEGLSTGFSDKGFTFWGFGEGFRPAGELEYVTETLQIYNPTSQDVLVEITIRFDNDLGQETFRKVVPARKASVLNIHDFVTGSRRQVNAFYGLTVKSADPVVASMTHYDPFFPGAFSTLGTPLGYNLDVPA